MSVVEGAEVSDRFDSETAPSALPMNSMLVVANGVANNGAPRAAPPPSRVAFIALGGVAGALIGAALGGQPLLGVVVALLIAFPGLLFTFQSMASFVADWEPWSRYLSVLGLFAIVVPMVLIAKGRVPRLPLTDALRRAWPAFLLLVWLAVVTVISGDLHPLPSIAWCLVALLTGLYWGRTLPNRSVLLIGLGGWVVLIWNALLLSQTANAGRFTGTAGSPNMLVFGIAILAPAAIASVGRRGALAGLLSVLVYAFLAWPLVTASGSAQAVVCVPVALALGAAICVRRPLARWTVAGVIVGVFVLALRDTAVFEKFLEQIGGDLSGRSTIWAAALNAVAESPISGLGTRSFSSVTGGDYIVDRAAHNATLAILVWGGLVALVLWVLTLIIVFRRRHEANVVFGATVIVCLLGSLVGNMENLAVFWLVVGLALGQEKSMDATKSKLIPHSGWLVGTAAAGESPAVQFKAS